jgi:hypothetical protein
MYLRSAVYAACSRYQRCIGNGSLHAGNELVSQALWMTLLYLLYQKSMDSCFFLQVHFDPIFDAKKSATTVASGPETSTGGATGTY